MITTMIFCLILILNEKNSLFRNGIRSIINDNCLRQVVNYHTHVTKNLSIIIDYVIINNYEITSEKFKTNKISDHEVVVTLSLAKRGEIHTGFYIR